MSTCIVILAVVVLLAVMILLFWPPQTRRFLRWFLWGCGLTPADENVSKHDIEALVGLLAIILGGTVTLGAGIQQSGRVDFWYTGLYVLAGLIPLIAMLCFVHSSTLSSCKTVRLIWTGSGDAPSHAYDNTTVRLARYIFSVSLAFILLIVLLVATEHFPGQSRANRLLYPSLEQVEFLGPKDDTLTFRVPISINTQVYEHGLPSHLTPNLIWRGDLRDFDVAYCHLTDLSKQERVHPNPGWAPVPNTPEVAPKTGCVILKNLASNGNYRLDVFFQGKSTIVNRENIKTHVTSDLEIIDRPPP